MIGLETKLGDLPKNPGVYFFKNKSGKIIFSKLSRRGETQAVQGKPPFSVVVGNAAGVRIAYNGKPFDLAPHIKVNVARFKLE